MPCTKMAMEWGNSRRRFEWNNEAKLQLLRVLIKKTENPMVSADRPADMEGTIPNVAEHEHF